MPDPRAAWDALRLSWARSLRARNLAPKTLKLYDGAAACLVEHLASKSPRLLPADLRQEHIEVFLADHSAGRAPATISLTYRALQQWLGWMVEQDELTADPTARMHAPVVPERPVPVLTDDQLRALLASCEGRRLVDRRDVALFRLLIDTGGRLAEIGGLAIADVDLDGQVCRVTGKGRRERVLPFGIKTTEALDRYLRVRAVDKHASSPGLWLGERGKGPLTFERRLPGGQAPRPRARTRGAAPAPVPAHRVARLAG